MRLFPTAAATIAGLTLGLFLPSAWSDPPKTPAVPATPADVSIDVPRLRMQVFDLERAQSSTVVPVLRALLGPQDSMMLALPVAPLAGQGGFGGFGGHNSGFGGGSGGFGSNYASYTPRPNWRAAVSPNGKVVLRGSERDLAVAAEIIRIVDRPAGTVVPQGKYVRNISTAHLSMQETKKLVSDLGFDAVIAQPLDARVLLATGPLPDLDQLVELVRLWDVPKPQK